MNVYLTDGSADGFFTAVFDAYRDEQALVTSLRDVQLGFDCRITEVRTDGAKAGRVRRRLDEYDRYAIDDVLLLLRSCESRKEQVAFGYIRLIMEKRRAVRDMTNIPVVMEMTDIRYKVTGELHRLKGFLRFIESESGALYAPYSPDNDITELIAPHFAERLKNQKFVIHDVRRKIAALYDGSGIVMFRAEAGEIYLSENEKIFENLWKLYYQSVNVRERPHEKQMKGYMPVRYWKFLPEKH